MELLERCRKMISFDSTPAGGTRELAEWLAEECKSQGLSVELFPEQYRGVEQANICVRPSSQKTDHEFLLQTHLDTTDPGRFSLWTQNAMNPFDATISDGRIYGLGAADAKLDFVCKLEALKKFKNQNLKSMPVLVGTFGEEIGMQGMLKLIRKEKIKAKRALVGEPSGLQLIHTGKGFAAVEIELSFSKDEMDYRAKHNLQESTSTQSKVFVGKPGHSAEPDSGVSAIYKMFEYISNLPDGVALMEMDGGINYNTIPSEAMLEIDLAPQLSRPILKRLTQVYQAIKTVESRLSLMTDPRFVPPTSILNIGSVRTLSDRVVFVGSCRVLPGINLSEYTKLIEYLSKECEKVGGLCRLTEFKQPYNTPLESEYLKSCQQILQQMDMSDECITQANTNEASLLARVGVECISFGPGRREGNVYTPNENVLIDDLRKSIEFYTRAIERFCI